MFSNVFIKPCILCNWLRWNVRPRTNLCFYLSFLSHSKLCYCNIMCVWYIIAYSVFSCYAQCGLTHFWHIYYIIFDCVCVIAYIYYMGTYLCVCVCVCRYTVVHLIRIHMYPIIFEYSNIPLQSYFTIRIKGWQSIRSRYLGFQKGLFFKGKSYFLKRKSSTIGLFL